MIFIKRLTPYLSAGLLILFFELSLQYYEKWLCWLILVLFVVIFTVLFLNNFRFTKETLGFTVSPTWFLAGALAFLYFQEKELWQQIIIFSSIFIYWLFINNISIFLYKTKAYLPYSLENISNYLNLLAVFFIYVTSFSFYILSVSRLRWMMLLVLASTLFLTWQSLWINKVHKRFQFFIFILSIIIAEMYWVLHFWPTSFFVNGIILTVAYYLFTTFIRLHHLENLTRKNTAKYLALSSIILTVILATAQWT